MSKEELEGLGFSNEIINAIDFLSKKLDESYDEFILRLSSNELARKVKIEDIKDNLDVTRLSQVTDKDLFRVRKYHKALHFLLKNNK